MPRKRPDFVDSWIEYTEPQPTPLLWRRWAGIFMLAASMERRLWVKTNISKLYPNLYVILVGPPGVGKTLMTSLIRNFLHRLNEDDDKNAFHLANESETHASIGDSLREATRRFIDQRSMEAMSYNALTVVSNELGVFLPEYDSTMMNKMTSLYDGHIYSERRRTKDLQFVIEQPTMNMIAATTPSYLIETLPPGAWDQGFLSRTMIAFSSESLTRDLFGETIMQEKLEIDLIHDLKHIFGLSGPLTFEKDAIVAIETWNRSGRQPLPDHPRLLNYNTRRAAHLLKLCMIACVSDSDERVVTLAHFRRAMDWLIELEVLLPEIFKAMQRGGDSQAMEECWHYCALLWKKDEEPIAEQRIISYLIERIPAQNIGRVLEIMIRTGMFIEIKNAGPGKWYMPKQMRH